VTSRSRIRGVQWDERGEFDVATPGSDVEAEALMQLAEAAGRLLDAIDSALQTYRRQQHQRTRPDLQVLRLRPEEHQP
jgi:hypothetical protein